MLSIRKIVVLLLLISFQPAFAETEQADTKNVNIKESVVVIDINSADIQTLSQLKGIGKVKAQAIVKYREQFGAFKSIDDLTKIKGIGKKVLLENKSKLTI